MIIFLNNDIKNHLISFLISFIYDILRRITRVYERHSVFFRGTACDVTAEIQTSDVTFNVASELFQPMGKIISIYHGCMVWIEKSVTRITDWHHEACRVMPNSDPE